MSDDRVGYDHTLRLVLELNRLRQALKEAHALLKAEIDPNRVAEHIAKALAGGGSDD